MNASDIAGRFALTRSGRSWRGTCPGCAYPRAFAIREGKAGRVAAFCANGCDRETLRTVLADASGGWTVTENISARPASVRRQKAALRLWEGSEAAPGTLADAYLTGRALPGLAASPSLRFRADTPHPEGGRLPALVALVSDASGNAIAAHRTFLAADGTGKAKVEPQRASLGPVWGCAVRLAEADAGGVIVVGEGIETAASAGRMIGLPAWAAISAGNLSRGLLLPPAVHHVVIAVDPDGPGETAAAEAAQRWSREGRRVQLAHPDGPGDFNDLLRARGVGHAR